MTDPGVVIRLLEVADAPACDEVVRSLPHHFEAVSEITWLAVHAHYRGQGIGRALAGRQGPAAAMPLEG